MKRTAHAALKVTLLHVRYLCRTACLLLLNEVATAAPLLRLQQGLCRA